MGPKRGRRRLHRLHRIAALAVVLAVAGLPTLAQGGTPGPSAIPGPVTGLEVDGNTVSIEALPARLRVVFHTDDLFRVWMSADGEFTDPANSPPERDGAPDSNIVVKHDFPGVTPQVDDAGAYHLLTTRSLALRVY